MVLLNPITWVIAILAGIISLYLLLKLVREIPREIEAWEADERETISPLALRVWLVTAMVEAKLNGSKNNQGQEH